MAFEEMAEYEKSAPVIEIAPKGRCQELIHKVVYPPREKRTISPFHIATFILSAAAIVFIALFVHFVPVRPSSCEIATLVDQMNVQWAGSSPALKKILVYGRMRVFLS